MQDLSIEIPFIRSLIEDLKERQENLIEICSDEELEKIKGDTSRLSEDFETLRQDALSITNFTDPYVEASSLTTDLVEASLVNKEENKTLDDLNIGENGTAASSRKTENSENLVDSDLDNESGVSSMESFESLLKRNGAHSNEVESCDSEHAVNGSKMERIEKEKGGISVSPNEYEELLQKQSDGSNSSKPNESPDVEDGSSSLNVSKKTSQVEVPLLIFTDENGEELLYSGGTNGEGDNSGEKPLTGENEVHEEYDHDDEGDQVTDDDRNKELNDSPLSDELDDIEHAQDVASDSEEEDVDNVQLEEDQPTKEEQEQEDDVPSVHPDNIESKNREESVREEMFNEVYKPKATNETILSDSEDSIENVPCHATDDHAVAPEIDEIKIESSSHKSIINSVSAANTSTKPRDFTDFGENQDNSRESSNMDQRSDPVGASIDLESESYLDFESQLTNERGEGALQTGQDLSGSVTPGVYQQEHPLEDVHVVRSPDIPTRPYVDGVPDDNQDEATEQISSTPRIFPGISNGDIDETGTSEAQEILDEIAWRRRRVRPRNSSPQEPISSYVRDSTAYQSPYFGSAFSRLRELDEYEVPLEEGMSLDVFVVEIEKLLEKLRVIEDMMRACQCIDDNVKDELARHVVSKTELTISLVHSDQKNLWYCWVSLS